VWPETRRGRITGAAERQGQMPVLQVNELAGNWHPSVHDLTLDNEAPNDPHEFALWKQVIDLRKALILAT